MGDSSGERCSVCRQARRSACPDLLARRGCDSGIRAGAARMLRTHLLAVRLSDGTDTLADTVLARLQGILALVDLIHDRLTPVAWVGAACDGRFSR